MDIQHTTSGPYTGRVSAQPALEPAIGFARRADALAIAEMSRDLIEHGLGWSWTPERVRRTIGQLDANAIVARTGPEADRPVGFALMRYGDTDAHLLLLAVRPSVGRRGVGAALVGWLEATARVAGLERIVLETRSSNGAARSFYRRLGFETGQVVPGYYGGRETSVRMVKALQGFGPPS